MSKERNSMGKGILDLPANVTRSIFRNPLPSSDRGRAATSFTNFFLHIQPVRVSRQALRPTYTMGLGLISFFLFVILTVTGVLLMFYYVPSTTQAYDRMLDLRSSVVFGVILRNMHRWAAHGMVACVFLHMCRVFFTGSYKPPREFNWVIGVCLFGLTLLSSFTGYLLPWDQLAFWAITVGTSIAGYAPFVGKAIKFILLGDATVGQEALLRFYVLHVVVLPLVLTTFVAVHFWRIRKDGGLAKPETESAPKRVPIQIEIDEQPAPIASTGTVAVAAPVRKFTIQGLVRGPLVKVGKLEEDTVFSWPNLLVAELFVLLLTIAGVMLVSFFFNAPLEQPVNVMHPPNPAKAPWYFLGLQEQVSYSAFWGGIGVPGIEVLLLLLLPYIDRGREGVGRWFARQRILANSIFLFFVLVNIYLIVIGTFFRGANWQFVSPF
ncbi:MAG TPA: cytochrome b N-terminal domain-containing protein [Terracidiphilus sp.]|jgi:quinol-cytochrome oxidoreductase complex cytochrome b subunit|nr:cytochrome b N-terminal domain-containing protein [Terracidiphilus sp.]